MPRRGRAAWPADRREGSSAPVAARGGWCAHGRWRAARGPGGRGGRRRDDVGAVGDRRRSTAAARRTSASTSRGCSRNQQSYTDTTRASRRRDDVVRAVDDVGSAEPPVDRRRVRDHRRIAAAAGIGRRRCDSSPLGARARHVRHERRPARSAGAERSDHSGDGVADSGSLSVQRADVDRDADRAGRGNHASRERTGGLRRPLVESPALCLALLLLGSLVRMVSIWPSSCTAGL